MLVVQSTKNTAHGSQFQMEVFAKLKPKLNLFTACYEKIKCFLLLVTDIYYMF
jgi:hypothetical protein